MLAPVLSSGLAVIGDVTKFVTAGDARIEISETSTVYGSSSRAPARGSPLLAGPRSRPTSPDAMVAHDLSTGVWSLDIDVPDRGWASVLVEA